MSVPSAPAPPVNEQHFVPARRIPVELGLRLGPGGTG